MAISQYRPSALRPLYALLRAADIPVTVLHHVGHQITFVGMALGSTGSAARRYRRQTMLVLSDFTFGKGAIVVGGGTLGVMLFLGVAVGGSIGIQGYSLLDMVNLGPLTGVVSAYASTRELVPMVAAIGFAAQAGCRITAEIGAMRISEEIDALEANSIRPIPFVVSTRIVAGVACIIPMYIVTLIVSYLSAAFVVVVVHGQSPGTYQTYFGDYLAGTDVVLSTVKVTVFVVLIVLIHGYQGFYASGGPEGVGAASGRAIRASLILVVLSDMVMTLLFWGIRSGIQISG